MITIIIINRTSYYTHENCLLILSLTSFLLPPTYSFWTDRRFPTLPSLPLRWLHAWRLPSRWTLRELLRHWVSLLPAFVGRGELLAAGAPFECALSPCLITSSCDPRGLLFLFPSHCDPTSQTSQLTSWLKNNLCNKLQNIDWLRTHILFFLSHTCGRSSLLWLVSSQDVINFPKRLTENSGQNVIPHHHLHRFGPSCPHPSYHCIRTQR